MIKHALIKMHFTKQLTGYTKHFDNNKKYINPLVNDKKLLKKIQ